MVKKQRRQENTRRQPFSTSSCEEPVSQAEILDHLSWGKEKEEPPEHSKERLRHGVLPGGMSEADGAIRTLALNSADVPILGGLGSLSPAHLGSEGTDRAQLPFPARSKEKRTVPCALRCSAAVSGMGELPFPA